MFIFMGNTQKIAGSPSNLPRRRTRETKSLKNRISHENPIGSGNIEKKHHLPF